MLVTRKSPMTGKDTTLDLDVTQAQLDLMTKPLRQRPMIQDIFPNLNADEREFILSGYTPSDWNALFPPEGD